MQIIREDLPTLGPSEEQQALAAFNHAAEQKRFLLGQQWRITNYALIAFAVLTAAPSWVKPESWIYSWRSSVSLIAFVLVWMVVVFTFRNLRRSERSLDRQDKSLREARKRLKLMSAINKELTGQEEGSEKRRRFLNLPVKWVLSIVLVLGASIASLIIVSRIPVPQVVACISQ